MTSANAPGPALRNRLLLALPPDDRERLAASLERVSAETRQVLFDVNQPIEHVYFPEDFVGSVVGVMSDGSAVETATVGHEGMVGLPLYLGADRTAAQWFAQIPGAALKMTAADFRAELARSEASRGVLDRYTQALFTLVAQSSACNRFHRMEERCARWLHMCQDRVGRAEFALTHQFLSQMLGARRATVTEAAGALPRAGLIQYTHGRITVRDRPALEPAACAPGSDAARVSCACTTQSRPGSSVGRATDF